MYEHSDIVCCCCLRRFASALAAYNYHVRPPEPVAYSRPTAGPACGHCLAVGYLVCGSVDRHVIVDAAVFVDGDGGGGWDGSGDRCGYGDVADSCGAQVRLRLHSVAVHDQVGYH